MSTQNKKATKPKGYSRRIASRDLQIFLSVGIHLIAQTNQLKTTTKWNKKKKTTTKKTSTWVLLLQVQRRKRHRVVIGFRRKLTTWMNAMDPGIKSTKMIISNHAVRYISLQEKNGITLGKNMMDTLNFLPLCLSTIKTTTVKFHS